MSKDKVEFKLQEPSHEMDPEDKGELLFKYVESGVSVSGLDFRGAKIPTSPPMRIDWRTYHNLDYRVRDSYGFVPAGVGVFALVEANFDGAILDDVHFGCRDLSLASFRGASLARSVLSYCYLKAADFTNSILVGARLIDACAEGACFRGARLDYARVEGLMANQETVEASSWNPSVLRGLIRRGVTFPRWGDLPPDLREMLDDRPGLTFSFDISISRMSPMAFQLLILDVLGDGTDVSVVQNSGLGDVPGFVCVDGASPEELVAIATAFHEESWRRVHEEVSHRAVAQLLPESFSIILSHLDELRQHYTGGALNHPDVQEMLFDAGESHVKEKLKGQTRSMYGPGWKLVDGALGDIRSGAEKRLGRHTVRSMLDAGRQIYEASMERKKERQVRRLEREADED